jgi:predicted  nucleic acid-binding Zn-ribbon protein
VNSSQRLGHGLKLQQLDKEEDRKEREKKKREKKRLKKRRESKEKKREAVLRSQVTLFLLREALLIFQARR